MHLELKIPVHQAIISCFSVPDNWPYFSIKTYFVTRHYNRCVETVPMRGQQHTFLFRNNNQNSAESGVAPAPGWWWWGGVGGGGGGGGGGGNVALVQHQLQQWAKYWYGIVWDVLTQSIYKG